MYTRYENVNGLTWMVNENATYNGKKVCKVIFSGTKENPFFEETIYGTFEDFYKIYGLTLKKVED